MTYGSLSRLRLRHGHLLRRLPPHPQRYLKFEDYFDPILGGKKPTRKQGIKRKKSLLQNSVSFAEAMQFLTLWATKRAFLAVALANLKFCKCLGILKNYGGGRKGPT